MVDGSKETRDKDMYKLLGLVVTGACFGNGVQVYFSCSHDFCAYMFYPESITIII
jgi:hypothetical protein